MIIYDYIITLKITMTGKTKAINLDWKIYKTRNYFIEEIKQNKLMSKKHKKVSTASNCIEHLLVLASAVTRCASISALVSLVSIPIWIVSSAVGIKICAITARIKEKKKPLIKKKKNKHDKIVLLAKLKFNSI